MTATEAIDDDLDPSEQVTCDLLLDACRTTTAPGSAPFPEAIERALAVAPEWFDRLPAAGCVIE